MIKRLLMLPASSLDTTYMSNAMEKYEAVKKLREAGDKWLAEKMLISAAT